VAPGVSSAQAVLTRLRAPGSVLWAPGFPGLIYCHGRWHLVTLDTFASEDRARGIVALNFMSRARAEGAVREWAPHLDIRPFGHVSPILADEVTGKILSAAEDYWPLLDRGLVRLAGGHTTDTLAIVSGVAAGQDQSVAAIRRMMCHGAAGPFLAFGSSCRRFVTARSAPP
jgi:hypothetical protein